MVTIKLRPATPFPTQEDSSLLNNDKHIIFKHPGYPDEYKQSVLFRLNAWDIPSGGLHSDTALLACSLIACNAWDGYLTVERDGQKLELQGDDILSAPEYYFHVPEPLTGLTDSASSRDYYKYPIYPTFQHWAFPHEHIPLQWRRVRDDEAGFVPNEPSGVPSVSAVTAAVIACDKACIISKHRDYIERAHLCPRSELDWYNKNSMQDYNARGDTSGDASTDDTANGLSLRIDIHRAFDEGKFTLVRKAGRWVAHFFEATCELGSMYHNRAVEVKRGVGPEFILARFALTIFPRVKRFMEKGPERLVKVLEQCNGELHEVVKTLDPAGFAQIAGGPRGRSASPKKRKASETLLPIVEAKRCRESSQMQAQQSPKSADICGNEANDQNTPGLSSDPSTSLQPHLPEAFENPYHRYNHPSPCDIEADRLSSLRMRELRKRRPSNPALYCCDYSLAEHADALGVVGKREYGGGHLCDECVGWVETEPNWEEESSLSVEKLDGV